MKKKLIVLIALLSQQVGFALTVDFCGYVRFSDGTVLFALKDSSKKISSPWLRVGQRWDGWTLIDFDSRLESIQLSSGETKTRLRLMGSTIKEPLVLPSFEGGNFQLEDGTKIYGHEAILHLGSMMISSPSGVMVSTKTGAHISGDLVIQTPQGEFKTSEASVELVDGHPHITAETMTFAPKKAP